MCYDDHGRIQHQVKAMLMYNTLNYLSVEIVSSHELVQHNCQCEILLPHMKIVIFMWKWLGKGMSTQWKSWLN